MGFPQFFEAAHPNSRLATPHTKPVFNFRTGVALDQSIVN
jgi:hypothetical protein